MKPKILLCLALLAFNLSAQARPVRWWRDAELAAASDLVVVGRAITVNDLDETNSLGFSSTATFQSRFRGVETTFKISAVLKGTPANNQIVLHHYRVEIGWGDPPNGPTFISFTPGGTNEYLLYLKQDGTNRYAPAAGQVDPGISVKSAPGQSDPASIGRSPDAAKDHFREYLVNCETNGINCLWFLHNDLGIGMVMTIHLDQETVYTVRDVYDHALQGGEGTRRLTLSNDN